MPASDQPTWTNTGDDVLVTNGVYAGTVTVQVPAPLNLTSVNGAQFTVIDGGGTNRCVSLPAFGSLTGFTLTNGNSSFGGGVWCSTTNGALLTNCTIIANQGGGAAGATLYNCTLTGNSAQFGGGAFDCTAYNCLVFGNTATNGGGAYGGTLYYCTIKSNYSITAGGGIAGGELFACTVTGNSANSQGGGAVGGELWNCTITDNTSGNVAGGSSFNYLYNCTVTGNSATQGGGVSGGYLYNTIVYFNTAPYGANYDPNDYDTIDHCCTTPMPAGAGNITNAPLFIDYAGGNLRLQSNSPCINAGNNAYVFDIITSDQDGRPRIVGGTVDIGAYEFQPGISGVFLGWLQQYGLPTDGSADYIDSDGDGMNNWQEWICGTDPTNPASVLKMLSPAKATLGVDVTWLSVTNRAYFVQRSTNLALQPPFVTIFTNVAGQISTTTLTDTNATSAGPFFYRVGVEFP